MKYIYKTVSLSQFLDENKNSKIGMMTWGTQTGFESQASKAIENLMNYYAADGWEYVRSEKVFAEFFKSTARGLFESRKNNPPLQMFIFRKVYESGSLEKRISASSNQGHKNIDTKLSGSFIKLEKSAPDVYRAEHIEVVAKNTEAEEKAELVQKRKFALIALVIGIVAIYLLASH